jgi:hypothetical protein
MECMRLRVAKNREALQKVCTGALAMGILIKTGKGGQHKPRKKWTVDIKNKSPNCVIDV